MVKMIRYIFLIIWLLPLFVYSQKTQDVEIDLFLSEPMLKTISLETKLINSIDYTNDGFLLISSFNQFYVLGIGYLEPLFTPTEKRIESFTVTPEGKLLLVSGADFYKIDTVGNFLKIGSLPSKNMGVISGNNVVYIFDQHSQNGKSDYSLFSLGRDLKYSKLVTIETPITAVYEYNENLFFTTMNKLYGINEKMKSFTEICALPQERDTIISIAGDSTHHAFYISTNNTIYRIKNNSFEYVNTDFGGILKYDGEGLLVFNPEKSLIIRLRNKILYPSEIYAQDCNNENVQRYIARANIAIKEAQKDADFLDAVEEFKKALQYAPNCPDIYYNIAICYDKIANSELLKNVGYYSEVIKNFKKHLELKPNAPDKQAVQNKIYELEYKYDKLLNKKVKSAEPEMVFVQGGTFNMGFNYQESTGTIYEVIGASEPTQKVTLNSFYIGKYEITQGEWKAIMGNNPSSFAKGDKYPVENVSWDDIQVFIARLNEATGKQYRLPTEAEWEFAARGGSTDNSNKNGANKAMSSTMGGMILGSINNVKNKDYKYSGSNKLDDVAWHKKNSGGSTHPVGTKSPNELGIYDMSGNVFEWCNDWYGKYDKKAQSNPQGPPSGTTRVYRGGSWSDDAKSVQVSYRHNSIPNTKENTLGFRIACDSK